MIETSSESVPRTSVRVIKQHVTGEHIGSREDDHLAIEDPLEISLGRAADRSVLTVTMRTPGHDDDLIAGYLFAEGTIRGAEDIEAIAYTSSNPHAAPTRAVVSLRSGLARSPGRARASLTTTSACGVCGIGALDSLAISPPVSLPEIAPVPTAWIHKLPSMMREAQPTFARTGGLHAAALFDPGAGVRWVREDIGRHNALDKIIGARLRAEVPPEAPHVLCVSGRMSYEILQKAVVAGIPLIAGVGAPSSLAVSLAQDFGITLVGFVRNGSFNIYAGEQRIF